MVISYLIKTNNHRFIIVDNICNYKSSMILSTAPTIGGSSMKRKLSRPETERMIDIIQNKDEHSEFERNRALRILIKDYEGIIIQLATTYYDKRKDITDMTDLVSAGRHGFYKSVLTYDKHNERDAQFITYARKGTQMEILGAYRKQVAVRGVEASTFTAMAPKVSEDNDFDDGDIVGMSIKRSNGSIGIEDSKVSTDRYLRHNNKLSLVEELRHDPLLSVRESIWNLPVSLKWGEHNSKTLYQ